MEPRHPRQVDPDQLNGVQDLLHGLIRAVAGGHGVKALLRYPELSVLTDFEKESFWFPVPGWLAVSRWL
jgi:hypothetical protein